MANKRVFTKMVKSDAKYQPAVRITFTGRYQVDYFTLANAAEAHGTNQTNMGRQIISDWLRVWRAKQVWNKGEKGTKNQQIILNLKDEKKKKKGAKYVD